MDQENIQHILSDLIDLPENQMRRTIDRDAVHELSENIKANGLINPITVRQKGERFELVAGQRRLFACRYAGIIRIPCVVRSLDDISALAVMAAENLERRDVDIVDEANFIERWSRELNLTIPEIADKINRGEQYVRDRLAVASMPDYMQEFLKEDRLKIGVALTLMKIDDEETRRTYTSVAVANRSTVHEVSYWIEQYKLGLLPTGEASDVVPPNAPAGSYVPPRLRCRIDGRMYPPSDITFVGIYRGHEGLLDALGAELNKEPTPAESEHAHAGEPSPVGAAE